VQRPVAKWKGNVFVVQPSTQTLLGQGHDALFGVVSDSPGVGLPSVVATSTQSDTGTAAHVTTNENTFYVPHFQPAGYSIFIAPSSKSLLERVVHLRAHQVGHSQSGCAACRKFPACLCRGQRKPNGWHGIPSNYSEQSE
jgi:hypothetical protein